jgi:Conserved TM helix
MGQYIVETVRHTLSEFLHIVMGFLPRLLAMLIIIVVGWLIALLLKIVLRRFLTLVKFNQLFQSTNLPPVLTKASLPPPDELLSRLTFWGVGIAFIFLGATALGVVALQELIAKFFLFLPQFFVGLIVFFLGLVIANFFGRATLLAAVNANHPSPRLLSNIVQFLILIMAVTMALDQMGVGYHVILIAFSISFGAIMFGLAIAFGFGGREVARRILERRFPEGKEEEEDEISPL